MSGAEPPAPGSVRYALLDPARFRRPLTWLADKGLPAVPLLPLDAAPGMARVTPWLTLPDTAAAAALTAQPAPDWGLWIDSEAPLTALPGLLASRRMIADGAGTPLIFRWWDRQTLLPLWPVLTPEQAGLATVTVVEARRLGLEEARDWQALAQLLALLGSGLVDDPLFAPLVAPLLLRADRTRMHRTEPVLLGLGNARIAGGRKSLALLHTMFRHDALAASASA